MDIDDYMSIKKHLTHLQVERLEADEKNRDLLGLYDYMAERAVEEDEALYIPDEDIADFSESSEQLEEDLARLEALGLILRLGDGWDVGPLAFQPDDLEDEGSELAERARLSLQAAKEAGY